MNKKEFRAEQKRLQALAAEQAQNELGATPESTPDATDEPSTDGPDGPDATPEALPTLPTLPKLPKSRKPKTGRPCACGCAVLTRGGRFLPGHDGILVGWAVRVERGLIDAAPAPHTAAVAELVAKRATVAA